MVYGKWLTQEADISACLELRETVLGTGTDATDRQSQHALILSDGSPVATGRLYYDMGEFVIEYLCVLPPYRGQGYGDLLIRFMLLKAFSHGAPSVKAICNSPNTAFLGKYGFAACADGAWRVDEAHAMTRHCSSSSSAHPSV